MLFIDNNQEKKMELNNTVKVKVRGCNVDEEMS